MVGAIALGAISQANAQQFPAVHLPEGYRIEKVVDGLTFPTAIAWDDQGRMYVAETGGGFMEQLQPPVFFASRTVGSLRR